MARLLRVFLQKVPPVQRQLKRIADLEAAVQQQQIQIDALSYRQSGAPVHSTVAAALPAGPDGSGTQALLEEIAKRDQQIRILSVNYGATFEENLATGRAGGGTPYTFEELLSLQRASAAAAPTVPPLIFLHIPKAGGTTLNNILMKNYRFRMDSYGNAFFPRYYPDEFISLVQPPKSDDTRRPVYFTGHINIDNDIFRLIPVRYVALTMLRDPVKRVISHYRFHATLPGSRLAAAIKTDKLGVADYFKRFRADVPLQYEVFAPLQQANEAERVVQALRSLDAKVSLIGLQEQYDAFVVMMRELLGTPNVFHAPLNKTPSGAPDVNSDQVDELRDLLRHDIAFYEGAKKIYERRLSALGSGFADRVKSFGEAQKQYLAFVGDASNASHVWRRYYSG